jgi:hydrogenase maturation protease
MTASVLVIGTGNALRRDDGAGLEAAREVRRAGIEVREAYGDLSGLADLWAGRQRVIVVDAVRTGAVVGTVHRLDAVAKPLPAIFSRRSTHAIGIAEAVELVRALGRLPRSLVVYGIEGSDFAQGEGLTPEVARATKEAADRIVQEARHA